MTGDRQDAALAEQLGRLAADVGPAIAPAEQNELLQAIVDMGALAFRAQACSIAVLDEGTQELVFAFGSGGASDAIIGVRVPAGQGIAGWAATSGQAIAVDDVSRDDRFAREIAEATGYVPRAILAAPIETEEDVLGVVEVLDPPEGPPDMELLGLLARQAALALAGRQAFADMGRALLTAAAQASDGDLAAALEQAAAQTGGPDAELAELSAAFAELGRLGPQERAAATRLVTHFLAYARRR